MGWGFLNFGPYLRQCSQITGWTRLRLLVAVLTRPVHAEDKGQ